MITEQSHMTVAALMPPDPLIFGTWTPAATAERALTERAVSGAPVVDADGRPLGLVSQSELVNARAGGLENLEGSTVGELMAHPAMIAESDLPLSDAAGLMARLGVHRLVVVRPGSGEPIGVITAFDLIRAMAGAAEGHR